MNRIYHTWDRWECYPAGFYEDHPPKGISHKQALRLFKEMLINLDEFEDALKKVICEWKNSCEHYLTNENMNRIAWLGQAALAYKYHIPSKYRIAYHDLTDNEQKDADNMALKYLNKWLINHGEKELTMEEAQSKTIPNLY